MVDITRVIRLLKDKDNLLFDPRSSYPKLFWKHMLELKLVVKLLATE